MTELSQKAIDVAEKIYSDSAPIVGEDDYACKLTDHENEVNRAAAIIDQETAAPELLEALKDIILVTKHGDNLDTVLKQAEIAIAKATNPSAQGANDEKN